MSLSEPRAMAAALLGEALDRLEPYRRDGQLPDLDPRTLPQALAEGACDAAAAVSPPPVVRIVHQLACTGGTLISRCIAAMPNVRLLSEVDPLSPLDRERLFRPTDLVGLAGVGSRAPDHSGLARIFRAALSALVDETHMHGLDLVLRDHSHGHFCYGRDIPDRPGLRDIVAQGHATASLVTVRHPIDSFLSLKANGWTHFEPFGVDEYSKRYLAFLDYHSDAPTVRYEDFVSAPEATLEKICGILRLRYDEGFLETFSAIRLSGDSGRSGATIAPRPGRPIGATLLDEACASQAYHALCGRLGYELTR